jgi:hypothetical protein
VHQLQGKTEYVSLPLLLEFYKDKFDALLRHQAHARRIGQYDANNTYQYIINREEVQLTWVSAAIVEAGAAVPEVAEPAEAPSRAKGADAARAIFEADRVDAQAFMDRWRAPVEAMTNDRHRGMLRVILGETREQQRFFEQALAGRTDLLGRRAGVDGEATGEVLPARWIE